MARADQYVARAPRPGLPWAQVSGVLLLEISVVAVVLLALSRWYVAAVLLVLLILVLAIPIRGRSVLTRMRQYVSYLRRKPTSDISPDLPEDLVPLAEWIPGLTVTQTSFGRDGDLGLVSDGQAWTAVLALTADDDLLADTGEEIDIDALSGLTRQDDIVFAGVQIVTYTVPAPTQVLLGPNSPAAQAYREITDTQMPPTQRRTWLCLRLDPTLCLTAVTRRGANDDGVFATLRFGLHRVQVVLKRQGIETRALTPLELYEVLSLVSGSGADAAASRSSESWTSWNCDGLVHSSRLVRRWGDNASIGYQAMQDAVVEAPVLFAVTSYTFTPTSRSTGGIRLVTVDQSQAAVAMAHAETALGRSVRLESGAGAQVPAMLATIPLGRGGR